MLCLTGVPRPTPYATPPPCSSIPFSIERFQCILQSNDRALPLVYQRGVLGNRLAKETHNEHVRRHTGLLSYWSFLRMLRPVESESTWSSDDGRRFMGCSVPALAPAPVAALAAARAAAALSLGAVVAVGVDEAAEAVAGAEGALGALDPADGVVPLPALGEGVGAATGVGWGAALAFRPPRAGVAMATSCCSRLCSAFSDCRRVSRAWHGKGGVCVVCVWCGVCGMGVCMGWVWWVGEGGVETKRVQCVEARSRPLHRLLHSPLWC